MSALLCDNEGYKFVVCVFNFTFMAVTIRLSSWQTDYLYLLIVPSILGNYCLNALRYTLSFDIF